MIFDCENNSLKNSTVMGDTKMQIFVKNVEGISKSLEVESTDTVETVKLKIQDRDGIPPIQQLLTYQGKLLDDDKMLQNYNVKKGSTFDLLLRLLGGIKILITSGRTFTLNVEPSETVRKVKAKIHHKEEIPLNQLRLLFGGQQLKNNKPLYYYDIGRESTLHWYLAAGDNMQIFIRPLQNEQFPLDVELSDTIEIIKNKIQEEKNILSNQMRLFFEAKQLENSKTLKDYNIKKGSFLEMSLRAKRTIQIDVEVFRGKTLVLEMNTADSIGCAKIKIQQNIGISLEQIKLLFAEKELQNDKTLSDYDIKNRSLLHLELRSQGMQIFIEILNEKTFALQVEPVYTIEDVKAKIQDIKGISILQMNLFFNKHLLDDDHSLSSYDIRNGCTLQLALRSKRTIQIAITGKNFFLEIEPSEAIENIKHKIWDKAGISTNQVRLIFAGKQLCDDKSLDYYKITEESSICWLFVPRGSILFFVKNLFEKILALNVKPIDTIEKIKEKIQEIEGFPTNALKIFFDGKQLDDYKTVSYCNIKENSALCYKTILNKNSMNLFQF